MVKGVTRRIVVVPSPDPKIFEEAIFVVRDDFLSGAGVSQEDLLKEARRAADAFIKQSFGKRRLPFTRIPPPAYAAAGAAATAIAWLATRFAGV